MTQTSQLASRIRERILAAQVRVNAMPETMRAAVDTLARRVRTALDLPSRTELLELTQRLDELDRRISALADQRVAEMARVVPSLPPGEVIFDAAPVEAPVVVAVPVIEAAPAISVVEVVEAVEAEPATEPAAEAVEAAVAEASATDAAADGKNRQRKTARRDRPGKSTRR